MIYIYRHRIPSTLIHDHVPSDMRCCVLQNTALILGMYKPLVTIYKSPVVRWPSGDLIEH